MSSEGLRVLALADSDSYVKWSAALLATLPDDAWAELIIVETPLVVSPAQQEAALAGVRPLPVRRVPFSAVADAVAAARPDAVLIAARGPLVRVLARAVARLQPRPVLVTGLPGISIPATRAALIHRTQCDLFVLHSTREIRQFRRLAARNGWTHEFGLSRLPFAAQTRDPGAASGATGTDLVFAAQAIVPRERTGRLQIARMLVAAADADPNRRVVVKLRGVRGEKQTHHEHDSYPELLESLAPLPSNLVISTAPMSAALDTAEGLVTVSSTAIIEAVARGIPSIALSTFGVSDDLINTVFRGSGLLAGAPEVVSRSFRMPQPDWLADNYFHDPAADDWARRLADLVTARRAGSLPPKAPRRRRGGRVRDAWETALVIERRERTPSHVAVLAVGVPSRLVLRGINRVRSLRRPRPASHASDSLDDPPGESGALAD